ncbi:F0F1 ATP synthase subunit B (plasmid) [Acaryochloris sp. 'Moss Beach']|uniref:F0F1 ATP synthase subunit B n=1 Tax=Acaryochloris TaxID=155977 RepID=UPI001BB0AFE6|nr:MULTISPECIES: F0F1 ATP synthase subunit B [Acaryochloris]QUY46082.1 F0F1 ATP synthase subunit B [Acaryochloris marina S15]UJB72588.1 F0F1 ATP synthase subunit B [Acaryochloris sp. 'Moss Beach']
MLIDPLTVVAQIINFLILVALLRRFLYAPITQVMKKRERLIAQQLKEAAHQQEVAQQEAERWRQMQQSLEHRQASFLTQAQAAAEEHRHQLLQQIRDEVDSTQAQWKEAVKHERQVFLGTLQKLAGQQLTTTVRYLLQDLANADLEQQIIEAFLTRLNHLPASEQAVLRVALSNVREQKLMISSTFPIPQESRNRILEVLLKQARGVDPSAYQFTTAPDLMCGIELKIPGYKLAWTVEQYLQQLEMKLNQVWDGMEKESVEQG